MKAKTGASRMVFIALSALFLASFFASFSAAAQNAGAAQSAGATASASINILSPTTIEGVTGQFVTVIANVTNPSSNETLTGITYISIIDVNNSLPIDLEDWSAQKGLFLPGIPPHGSMVMNWTLRLVTAGYYTISVQLTNGRDLSPPVVSQ